jgi:hypothetical protein
MPDAGRVEDRRQALPLAAMTALPVSGIVARPGEEPGTSGIGVPQWLAREARHEIFAAMLAGTSLKARRAGAGGVWHRPESRRAVGVRAAVAAIRDGA